MSELLKAFHLLNGDVLDAQLRRLIPDIQTIICRECLVDGPVMAQASKELWPLRAEFMHDAYGVDPQVYTDRSAVEFEKVLRLPEASEVWLWFENDAFCQVNYWFCLHLLQQRPDLQLFRVFADVSGGPWSTFNIESLADIERLAAARSSISRDDRTNGDMLWKDYQQNNFPHMRELSQFLSPVFRQCSTIVDALAVRAGDPAFPHHPLRILENILRDESDDMNRIMQLFSQRAPHLGYGDLQVKRLMRELEN